MLLRDGVLVRRYQNGGMGKDEFVLRLTVLRDWLSAHLLMMVTESNDCQLFRALGQLLLSVSLMLVIDGTLTEAIRDTYCPF